MLAIQALDGASSGIYALAFALVVAAVYLFVLRLVDLNEKEPFWAIGLLFALGLVAGVFLHLLVGGVFLRTNLWGGAAVEEVTKFAAIAVGIGILSAVGRLRGWSEVSSLMDGVVYGAAAGLGYVVGEVFVRDLAFGSPVIGASGWGLLWPIALLGLADGLFAAIIGAGFGAAAESDRPGRDVLFPAFGLLGAFVAHAGYEYLRTGQSLSEAGVVLKWLALLLPLAVIVGLIIFSLVREQRAIAEELADEAEAGVVTDDELRILRSVGARRGEYLRRLFAGDLEGWIALRELHNRQVQLALGERRYRRSRSVATRAQLEDEIQRLRASILALKRDLSKPTPSGIARGTESAR